MQRKSTEPRTLPAFRNWLEEIFDELNQLCRYGEPNGFDQMQIAETVETAHRLACRFGGGHLIGKESALLAPRDGLAAVGRLLAWAEANQKQSAALLSDKEVGVLLGISARTVWRMLSTGEIASPIKVCALTKWRRSEIEAMIDLAEPMKG